MRIIGRQSGGDYIATISHTEIEKLAEKYYGKLPALKEGEVFDLGRGYDFRNDIRSACSGMEKAMSQFASAQATLLMFARMVNGMPEPAADSLAKATEQS